MQRDRKEVAPATPAQILAVAFERLLVGEPLAVEVDLVEQPLVDPGLDVEDHESHLPVTAAPRAALLDARKVAARESLAAALQPFDYFRRDRFELGRHRMGLIHCHQRHRLVAALAKLAHQRQFAQERNTEIGREARAAAMRENLVPLTAFAAYVIAHVL